MKAKQRTLAAILLLILLLGGLLWLIQRQSAQELTASSAAADGTIVLSSFAVGDLETIQYTYQGETLATVYKGNIIKNLIMDCQSYTKYRPNETTGGIFVSWRRKEELPTGA